MILDETEQVLAIGRLEKTSAKQGRIRYMAVDESAQGQGLGQKIIHELEIQATQLGMTEISLNARENALDFYQKQGFTILEATDGHGNEEHEPDYLMGWERI